MTQTAADRREGGRRLAAAIIRREITAALNWDDFTAAIGAIDDAMDLLPPALVQNRTVKQNLILALPEPFKSNSTAAQKALALKLWADIEAGVI